MSKFAPKSPRLDVTRVRAQIDALRAAHPDIWDEGDEQLLADTLEGETDLHAFLTDVVRRIVETLALSSGLEELIEDAKARKDRFEHRIETLRELALKVMQIADVPRVELPLATLSQRAGQPKIIVTNEASLPYSCVHIKRVPDKLAIRGYILQHGSCPGAEQSNAEPHLAMGLR